MSNEAISLLKELEWSGLVRGPGAYMGDTGGEVYRACPICRQLQRPNGDFIASAVGHKATCRLAQVLSTADRFEEECG